MSDAKEVAVLPENTVVTPASMIQMAIDKGTDVDQLSKLFELNERWEANEAKKAFVTAMSKFRDECPVIKKTRKAHNAMYAPLPEIISQIKDLMFQCGLSHSWKTSQTAGMTTVECVVTHIMGHSESTQLTAEGDKSGSKNSIQAIGSTVTYLQRYTLCSILGIAATDKDDDGKKASKRSNARDCDDDIRSDNLDEVLSEMEIKLDHTQVATTAINYFNGDKSSARDFITDAGFPIPSECNEQELRGILDALKKHGKAEEKAAKQ